MESLIIFLSLVLLLIAVLCIYGARGIVKNRVSVENENKVVLGMKTVGFVMALIALAVFCYFK